MWWCPCILSLDLMGITLAQQHLLLKMPFNVDTRLHQGTARKWLIIGKLKRHILWMCVRACMCLCVFLFILSYPVRVFLECLSIPSPLKAGSSKCFCNFMNMSKVLCGNSVGNMQNDLHIRNKENITAWDSMEVKMKHLQLCTWRFTDLWGGPHSKESHTADLGWEVGSVPVLHYCNHYFKY